MNRVIRTLIVGGILAAATTLPVAASAQAGTYFLNSTDPNNGVDVTLLAGTWTVGVSNGGWSPWNYVSNCDAGGNNCQTGFHTVFYYTLNGGPLTKYGWDGSERTQFVPERINDFYDSPERAFLHVFAPFTLSVDAPSTLHLFIPDCCYWDNVGGLGVTVAQAHSDVTVTPEPTGLALMTGGLAAVGFVVRRRTRVKKA